MGLSSSCHYSAVARRRNEKRALAADFDLSAWVVDPWSRKGKLDRI